MLFFVFPASSQSKIDSLNSAFIDAITPLEKFECQNSIANYYYKNHSYDTALTNYNFAVQLAPKNDFENKGKSIVRVATVYQAMEDLTNSMKFYKMALSIFHQNNCDPELRADVLRDIGRTFYGESHYDSAMVYYMRSKSVYEKNNIKNDNYNGILE